MKGVQVYQDKADILKSFFQQEDKESTKQNVPNKNELVNKTELIGEHNPSNFKHQHHRYHQDLKNNYQLQQSAKQKNNASSIEAISQTSHFSNPLHLQRSIDGLFLRPRIQSQQNQKLKAPKQKYYGDYIIHFHRSPPTQESIKGTFFSPSTPQYSKSPQINKDFLLNIPGQANKQSQQSRTSSYYYQESSKEPDIQHKYQQKLYNKKLPKRKPPVLLSEIVKQCEEKCKSTKNMADLVQKIGNIECSQPIGFTIAEKKKRTGLHSNCCSLKLKTYESPYQSNNFHNMQLYATNNSEKNIILNQKIDDRRLCHLDSIQIQRFQQAKLNSRSLSRQQESPLAYPLSVQYSPQSKQFYLPSTIEQALRGSQSSTNYDFSKTSSFETNKSQFFNKFILVDPVKEEEKWDRTQKCDKNYENNPIQSSLDASDPLNSKGQSSLKAKQQQIQKVINNRESLGNLMKLIEESPFEYMAGAQQVKQANDCESLESSQQIEDSALNLQNPNMKTNQLSLSELEMEKEKNLFVLNQDKMIEFIPLKSQLKRKNLTGKQCRENLLKILKHLKNLKLTPGEVMKHNVFSKKPFEKLLSYELITAVKHNDMTSCIELLQKNKYIVYDFDYIYMTALHWSCKRGHAKLSQLLIDKGSDVNSLDILGKSPLYHAAEQGHLEVVKVLLFNRAYPWSTRYVSYEKIEREYPLITSALLIARKIHVLLNMTPYHQRNHVWQKQGFAFAQILV